MLTQALERLIRWSGPRHFRGKGRLINHWMRHRPRDRLAIARLHCGARVECDFAYDYDCAVYLGQEEETELRVLEALLGPGDTFVDCGANLGLWSLVASTRVGRGGRVFAFEPNPATHARLERNLRVHNSLEPEVRTFKSAVGGGSGVGNFSPGPAHNTSRMSAVADSTTIPVPIVSLDAIVQGPVTGIKIDVEGFELDVIEGARALLAASRPWLCVEFNTLLAGTGSLAKWPVDSLLRELGYRPSLFADARDPRRQVLQPQRKFSGYVNLFYEVAGARR